MDVIYTERHPRNSNVTPGGYPIGDTMILPMDLENWPSTFDACALFWQAWIEMEECQDESTLRRVRQAVNTISNNNTTPASVLTIIWWQQVKQEQAFLLLPLVFWVKVRLVSILGATGTNYRLFRRIHSTSYHRCHFPPTRLFALLQKKKSVNQRQQWCSCRKSVVTTSAASARDDQ